MRLLYLLLILLIEVPAAWSACGHYTDCNSCVHNSEWLFSCRWCPLTDGCHSVLSGENVCSSSQQITSQSGKCSDVVEPSGKLYDPKMAAFLAKWCSLSYVFLENYSKQQISNAVTTYIDPSYQVVGYITSDCGIKEKGTCAAVISLSRKKNIMIIAFRGTISDSQLFIEFLSSLSGLRSFPPTGGRIASYFDWAHCSLYACVRRRVRELLVDNPKVEVYVTGHSLGGAEAQLTAVSLIADRIVPKAKVKVYTFGSPRVGDTDFAYKYDRMIKESWRVVNKEDPVPRIVPKELLFSIYTYHTRREIYYDTLKLSPTANYTVCHGNEDVVNCCGKNSLCVTPGCIYTHYEYFLPVLHEYMRDKMKNQISTLAQKQRGKKFGTCKVYMY